MHPGGLGNPPHTFNNRWIIGHSKTRAAHYLGRARLRDIKTCERGSLAEDFVLCAGLMTPHECPTGGLLPSECALRAPMPSEARADGERWRPTVRHSGGVVRPAPNIKPSRM